LVKGSTKTQTPLTLLCRKFIVKQDVQRNAQQI